MKANELRIGNVVEIDNGVGVVISVRTKEFEYWSTSEEENVTVEVDGIYYHCTEYELRGIPLTEEILLKLGLRWRQLPDRKYKQYIIHNDFCVEYDGNAFVFRRSYSEEVICFVPYLHTLQNAVYLVAGEELDVTELLK